MELQLEDSFDPVLVAPPSRRPKHLRRKRLRKSRTLTGAPESLAGNPPLFNRSIQCSKFNQNANTRGKTKPIATVYT